MENVRNDGRKNDGQNDDLFEIVYSISSLVLWYLEKNVQCGPYTLTYKIVGNVVKK